jgi:hypothetical protein
MLFNKLLEVALAAQGVIIDWIPAYAGMTKFRFLEIT